MTGTGARINPQLRTGDVILPTSVFLHDYGSLGEAGISMAGLQPPSVPNEAPLLDNDFGIPSEMHAKALKLIETYEKHSVEVDGEIYSVKIGSGRVTSGDFFGVPQSRIDVLRSMNVDIMEMEWMQTQATSVDHRLDALSHCLGKLPEKSRQLLKWRYHDGLSCQEVADRLKLELNAIYKRLSRLHHALRDCVSRRLQLNSADR